MSSIIRVQKISESYIKVRSEPHIEQELSQYFTFEVPGAKHTPKFKAKIWDGLIRLYNLNTKKIYAGLYDTVVKFAAQNEYQVEFVPSEQYPYIIKERHLDRQKVEEWVKTLNIHSNGEPITPRTYQIDALIESIEKQRIVLLAPTSSGKSLILYMLVRWFVEVDKKMLMIVPSVNLVQQMYNDFNDYSNNGEFWNVEDFCQEIYSGKSKQITKSLTISTWQSLQNIKDDEFYHQFNVAFCDEVHLAAAKVVSSIMERLTIAKYRIGTTGTIDDKSKTKALTLVGLFGPIHIVTTYDELMLDGHISNLKIKSIMLKYPTDARKVISKYKYQQEIDWLVTNRNRNKFITGLALSCKGNTLIFCTKVEDHAKPLIEMIKANIKDDRKVFGIFGSAAVEDLKKLIAQESNCIMVASYSKFSTGANVQSIRNIIFGSPSKSMERVLQSIGRGLRLDDENDKTHCNLFDLVDDLSYKSKRNYTLDHGNVRIKLYSEANFNYKFYETEIL